MTTAALTQAPDPATRCPATTPRCDFALIGPAPDMSGRVGPQAIWRCQECGHGLTMPALPDPAFLYEARESQDFQPAAAGLERRIKRWFFRRQARRLIAQLPADMRRRPIRMLDFGCGSGLFTGVLGEELAAADSTVTGADFHAEAPPELAGRPYIAMADLPRARGRFDVVQASHVLEHDDDSRGLLARIVATVRPGGVLVLEVPDIDCVWTRVFGAQWDAWYAPFHRSHFSRTSLCGMLIDAGLEIIAIHDICVPTMGRTLANLMGRKNTLPFILAGAALHPLQWGVEKLGHTPSALRAVVRKPL